MTVRHGHRVTGVATDPENRERHDFYPTPPEGVEPLLRVEKFAGPIWEPACGDGAISRVLERHGYEVVSTDLIDRGYGTPGTDYFQQARALCPNIITNPPFNVATRWIDHTVGLGADKVALLLRVACLAGSRRRKIYDWQPPARVWVFSKRLTIWRNGIKTSKAGGVSDFAWFVWDRSYSGPTLTFWIDPG
jgi:hypothetical protein